MRRHKQPMVRTDWILLILLASGGTGCDAPRAILGVDSTPSSSENAQQDESSESPSTLKNGNPDELVALIVDSQHEAGELERLLTAPGANHAMRLARFSQHINTGVAAAEKLALSSAASDEQVPAARQWKLTLLYQGAKHDPLEFLPRLESFVVELQLQGIERSLSAIGAAALIELRFLADDEPNEAALSEIVEYAKSYPECGAGVSLFQQYGKQLEEADQRRQAMNCYRTGVNLYGHISESGRLRRRLGSLEQVENAKRSQSQARDKKRADVRRQLGNWDNGYFLIYAREVKSPTGETLTLYSFEYEVLRGPEAAVSYVLGLKSNWTWELIRHFRDTPEEFRRATKQAEELTKKRAFIRY